MRNRRRWRYTGHIETPADPDRLPGHLARPSARVHRSPIPCCQIQIFGAKCLLFVTGSQLYCFVLNSCSIETDEKLIILIPDRCLVDVDLTKAFTSVQI